ncbi:hypothetical protein L915_20020 [Phytophthora nicotianae]|uniref:Uncharacterized protein n=1 Tax=Phytophthora nicotianae TaxID=4792 RepID=W2FQC4_PHYNI|nr:hypothetical protein L915_20020 [Phytophthora nicotianae]
MLRQLQSVLKQVLVFLPLYVTLYAIVETRIEC